MNTKDKLKDLLMQYFQIGDSYSYNLTRVKTAFAVGTVSLEDFEEFDESFIDDIVEYLLKNNVTVNNTVGLYGIGQRLD